MSISAPVDRHTPAHAIDSYLVSQYTVQYHIDDRLGSTIPGLRDSGMSDRFFDNWTTQLRKGLLEMCMLNAMSTGPVYGYDIVRQLREMDGLVTSEGTVYPILSRFKREGLVQSRLEESAEGPARKYYELTESGRQVLDRMRAMWALIVAGVQNMQAEGRGTGGDRR